MWSNLRQQKPVVRLVGSLLLISLLLAGCSLLAPGKTSGIPAKVNVIRSSAVIELPDSTGKSISVQYLGCGGLYILKGETGMLIDPFFSHQKFGRLLYSVVFDKQNVCSNQKSVNFGLHAIEKENGTLTNQVKAIFSTHSHYDHLMDVPAIFEKLDNKPALYLNKSGQNICNNVIGCQNIEVLEDYMTTQDIIRPPIELCTTEDTRVLIYPILSGHKAHFKNIKAFDGIVAHPLESYKKPFDKTKANDWLEGTSFSLLIDYLDKSDSIELRLFIQSSTCNPPNGIPPESLRKRPVDIAFLTVASYDASPDYPTVLLEQLQPSKIVWIHWEDFFRKYKKNPKPLRTADIEGFFNKINKDEHFDNSIMPWPRMKMLFHY